MAAPLDPVASNVNRSLRSFEGSLRTALGATLFATGLGARIAKTTSAVLAFHRVNRATAGDGITCDPDVFRAICAFARSNFEVVTLSQLVDCLQAGPTARQRLAITFDDGYLDNYTIAAPILREFGLPATFFVACDFIGSRTTAHWDRSLQASVPWMTWAHVSELVKMGFEIGSHTCSHPDLGITSGAHADREIHGSRLYLQDKTSQAIDHFAYPFGGKRQLSKENLQRVRDAGYASCSSCYGGQNNAQTDPHELLRVPVANWYSTAYQLGLAIKTGRG